MARQDFIDAKSIVDELEKSFRNVEKAVVDNAETLKRLQSEYNKLPSGFIAAQKTLLDLTIKQSKAEEQLLKTKERAEKVTQQQINTTSKELRLQRQRELQLERNAKAAEKEAQKLQASASLYNTVQQKLNTLNKEYRDLAVQKELTGKLTDKEAKRYDFLSGKITKYDTILKGVDASMGKYGRNVGNYASAFNPLQNSINQLSRELPAFANSAQTGFMAISNNLPILFDAISQINAQNKILREQGQQTQSVFRSIAGSIFSLGTALSLGVTLLTLFGDEIIDSIFSTKDKAKADEAAKKAVDEKNAAEERYNDTIRQSASEEISRSKLLFENAKNVNLSMEQRRKAIDDLRERYPKYLKNLSDQEILAGDTAVAEAKLNDALLKRGIALALQDKIRESYAKLTDQIIEQQKAEDKSLTITDETNKAFRELIKNTNDNASATETLRRQQEAFAKVGDIVTKGAINRSKDQQKETQKEIQQLIDLFNKYSSYLDVVEEGTDATSKQTKEVERLGEANSAAVFQNTISRLERELSLLSKENAVYGILALQLQLVKDAYEAMYGEQEKSNEEIEKTLKFGTSDYYQDQISKLRAEQSAVADSTDEYQLYNNIIKSVQDQLDKLTGKTEEATKSTKELDEFLKSTSSGALSDIGFSSLNFFTELDENGQSTFQRLMAQADTFGERAAVAFKGISDVALQAFQFINQQSQASFQMEYENLERRYEIAQRFAGEGEAAQEEVRRQYEERRRDIRRRELEAQKEQAIFNATVNVAQGITAALATANIPLSILIGALGAAQIAFIASQQIPAYFQGTDNHIGGKMLVNDGGGANYREMIVEPNKAPYIPTGRNKVINAPKGTKVFTAHETKEIQSLNKILMGNDIAPISDTLTRDTMSHISILGIGPGMTKQEMYEAVKQAVGEMTVIRQHWDRNGMNEWHENQGNKTTSTNNRVSFKGISL